MTGLIGQCPCSGGGGSKDKIVEARQAIVGHPPIRNVLQKLKDDTEVHPVDLSIMTMWG